ncbi:MAG: TetR family transcriptional regulator [Alphaproteobacteria bacterium]|nr:TetR family transcriptional regulator [Alphaproteobacteria bacterium]
MATSGERRTWRRRAQARPDEILSAALDAFIASGFDAATMDDIARRAGVTKGALYLYFESKEQMLRALIDREVRPLIARVEALSVMETDDPAALIKQALLLVTGALADPRLFALPRLIIALSGRFPDVVNGYRDDVVGPARAAIGRLVMRGQALGQFRAVDPVAAARAIIGPMMFEIMWAHVLHGESDLGRSAGWIEAQVDVLIKGLEPRGAQS